MRLFICKNLHPRTYLNDQIYDYGQGSSHIESRILMLTIKSDYFTLFTIKKYNNKNLMDKQATKTF